MPCSYRSHRRASTAGRGSLRPLAASGHGSPHGPPGAPLGADLAPHPQTRRDRMRSMAGAALMPGNGDE